ncbi:hypothetical protein BDZ97DRAFT_1778756 [Flammula alnicola]|nr:hypothetical protein BDZ97DRAFT_1778756 [Flammula alnicola]
MTSVGGYIRWSCYQALGHLFTFEMSIRKDHQLISDGPYSIVRHPGYTGILLTVMGITYWHASPGSWARECGVFQTKIGRIAALAYLTLVTTISIGLILRVPNEDAALKRTFGKKWDDWARRVPYKLIPWVY